jgi:hypothetical protein
MAFKGGKFNKDTGSAESKTPAGKGKPAPGKKSRFAGVAASQPRDPIPEVGAYRFRFVTVEEGYNEGNGCSSAKTTLEIVAKDSEHHEVGDHVFIPERITGNGSAAGRSRFKAMVVAGDGHDTEAEYDEKYGADGLHLDACLGESNAHSKDGQPLIGRLVDCEVRRGKTMNDGSDYFREYSWEVVPEEEQDAA